MHAFLIISKDGHKLSKKIKRLKSERSALLREVPAKKIEDIRNLGSVKKLKTQKPTIFLLRDIDEATPEAANALLKSIETPGKNTYFVLTARLIYNVLPTIVSRCQVIKIGNSPQKSESSNITQAILSGSFYDKIKIIEKIKGKDEALKLIENIILQFHSLIHKSDESAKLVMYLKNANLIRGNLLKNGNVNLQLAKFLVDSN